MELTQIYGAYQSSIKNGATVDMTEIETAFREAALRGGSMLLSKLLSEIPETAPDCGKCGEKMRNLDRREKQLVTLLGNCVYWRNYYGCDCGEHSIPKDELLEVSGTGYTQSVKRVTAQVSVSDSFRDTSATLKMLCGIEVNVKDAERMAEGVGSCILEKRQEEIKYSLEELNPPKPETPIKTMYIEYDGTGVPMRKSELEGRKGKQVDGSGKTREMKTGCIFTQSGVDDEGKPIRDADSTTYFSHIGELEEFSQLLYSESVKRGVDYAERVVVLGDGAKWIWSLATNNFPDALQIIDLYHAKEHIFDLLRSLIADVKLMHLYKDGLYTMLENGDIARLVDVFSNLPAETEDQKEKIETESNYFMTNKDRMQYQDFHKQGLFVGSGVIEAACKNVIGKRLKQSGMLWSVDGANKMAALRCFVLSGGFVPNFMCCL